MTELGADACRRIPRHRFDLPEGPPFTILHALEHAFDLPGEPRVVVRTVIDRPIEDVLDSLSAVFGRDMGGLRAPLERLADQLSVAHPLIKRVRYADLDDREALVEAAEWLAPGSGEQAVSLMDVNIQVTRGRALSLMTAPHTLWHLERAA